MKRVSIVFVIILLIVTSCDSKKLFIDDGIILVDVTARYLKKELLLQELFDIEYIPLETSDDFITSASFRAIGKEVIIVDNIHRPLRSDGNLFVFDRNGKGLRKINRMGQGGEEYRNIGGVVIDESNDELFVNSHFTKKVLVYDLLGNFKWSFGHKEGTFFSSLRYFNQDNLICIDGENLFDDIIKDKFLIISKQDGNVTMEIPIPYEEKYTLDIVLKDGNGNIIDDAMIRNQTLIPYGDSWLIVEVSSDTIYRIQPDYSMIPFIVKTPSLQSMNTDVFLFPGVLTDRYYFMQAVKKEFDFSTRTDFPRTDILYDRQENTLFEYVVYNDDFTDKKTVNLGYDWNVLTLVNNNEIAFIQRLEAFDLVEAYENGQLKGKLKEIAAELDEESNPVIMIAKYKKK